MSPGVNITWKAELCHTQSRGQYANIGVARPQPSSSGQVQVSKRRGVYSGKLVVGSLLQRDWSSSSLIVGKLKTIPDEANKSFPSSGKAGHLHHGQPQPVHAEQEQGAGQEFFTNIKQESKAAAFSWTCYSVFSNKL